jgi:hypothetical protein
MKKTLIYAMLLFMGLSLQAQNLYVVPITGEEEEYLLSVRPRIVFGDATITVSRTTFHLDSIRKLSFVSAAETNIAVRLEEEEGKILLYPNPVQDELNLRIDIPIQDLSYRIFDLNGRQIRTGRIHSETMQIPMQNFQKGTYVLRVERSGQIIQSFKIIKQ